MAGGKSLITNVETGDAVTNAVGEGRGSTGVPPIPTSIDLASRVVGLPGVLFQSVTFMAPGIAIALGIAAGAAYAGGALVLSVLLAMLGSLLVANSIGQLARRLSSAGSIYVYPTEGLHRTVGFLVVWGYSLACALVGPITSLVFGYLSATILQTEFGWPFTATWITLGTILAVLIAVINFFGVRMGTIAGTVLGLFEIVVFLVLSAGMIVSAGSANTGSVFTLHWANVPGFAGLSGVIAGAVYVMIAFIGFEAAAPLAEETRDPKRLIPRAVLLSCVVIGLVYVFTTYALSVFVHPAKVVGYGALGGGSPWIAFGRQLWGVGWVVVLFAILNSAFANGNSAAIAVSRTWFAMGRIGLLPRGFARVNAKHNAPIVGLVFQACVSIVVGIPLGLKYGPLNAFLICATTLTAIMLSVYIVLNVSCFAFYYRKARGEFNWLLHLVFPLLGTIVFFPVLLAAVGKGHAIFSFVAPLPYPLSLVGPIIAAWMALGVLYLGYLLLRAPATLEGMATVFDEE